MVQDPVSEDVEAGGTGLKIRPILQEIKFGGDVAENDEDLDLYFVETSAFLDVIADEADLILGPKGSGKTAIFRRIADPEIAIPEIDDVDILPAFNIQGSVIFRRLTTDTHSLDEAIMRAAWMAYILSLVGNHLLETYSDITPTERLRDALVRSGLRVDHDRPKSVWNVVLQGLRRLANPSRVETALTFGDSGIPIMTGKAEFDEVIESDGSTQEAFDLEELLIEEQNICRALGRRCWIVFDRLDEAFQHSRDLERVALRGLLRAHLDICSYGRLIRTKLFLRTDVLNRVTEKSGFVNATHIQVQRIIWDHKSIVALVAKRIIRNEAFRDAFQVDLSQTTTETDRQMITLKVLPAYIQRQDVFGFIIQRTTDAHDEPNPRNVLTLLRLARISQLQICDRDDPDFEMYGSLIGSMAVNNATVTLSRTRLEDTLFAEFNELRPYVERLRGRIFYYNRAELAKIFDMNVEDEQFDKLVQNLKYSGFMRETSGGKISVPLLYRPDLNLLVKEKNGTKEKTEVQRERQQKRQRRRSRKGAWIGELGDQVRLVAEDVRETGVEREMNPMNPMERGIVHEVVQEIAGVTAVSIGEGDDRRVVLRPDSDQASDAREEE